MVDAAFEMSIHALLLRSEEYEALVEAREEMYGDEASGVPLSHVIAILAKQEIAQSRGKDVEESNFDDPEVSE